MHADHSHSHPSLDHFSMALFIWRAVSATLRALSMSAQRACRVHRSFASPSAVAAYATFRDYLRSGFTVTQVEDGEYFGFTVDGNSRFLMSDFVVTHNTCAFLVPMLCYIARQPQITTATAGEGPYALIMAPTRELAQQISEECDKFSKYMNIRNVSNIGGHYTRTHTHAHT
jgi:hypothetical protein